jgi:hypothetical protein
VPHRRSRKAFESCPSKTTHGTGRGASNDGQAILKATLLASKPALTWPFKWSYGDSNSGPLACHARQFRPPPSY